MLLGNYFVWIFLISIARLYDSWRYDKFSILLYKYCSDKLNRLPDISPAKIGLFKISRELQFRVCNHGKPHTNSYMAREGGHFYGGKGSWEGYSKQRVNDFLLAESLPGKKRSVSSSCWTRLSSQVMRAPILVSQLYLFEVFVY